MEPLDYVAFEGEDVHKKLYEDEDTGCYLSFYYVIGEDNELPFHAGSSYRNGSRGEFPNIELAVEYFNELVKELSEEQ